VRGENDPNSPSQQPGPPQPPTGAARALAALPDAALVAQAKLGNAEALEILLRRRWRRWLSYAEWLCGDPDTAKDLCQEACLKAVTHLSDLRDDNTFWAWVQACIINEARREKRNSKKGGTPLEEIGSCIIEDMSVEPPIHAAEDLKCLQAVLWQEATALAGPAREAATFMLEYFGQEQELPPVRTIAQATHTSQGTAERCREFVLHRWRRVLTKFGFSP
jgi:RNA polymerase sigma factor (sigma-70 family)